MAFAINLGRVEQHIADVAVGTAKQGARMIEDAIDDAKAIYQNASACLARLDQVRIQLSHRTLEFATTITQQAVGLLYPLIEQIWQQVQGNLQEDPNPTLYWVEDPQSTYHGGSSSQFRIFKQANPALIQGLDLILNGLATSGVTKKKVLVFVHGMGYSNKGTDFEIASGNALAQQFENQAEIFLNGNPADTVALLVMYNSDLTQNQNDLIVAVASEVLKPIGIEFPDVSQAIILGVMWRELERRAALVSQFLRPYVEHVITNRTDCRLCAVSNSLGCYVWADLMNRMASDGVFHAGNGGAGNWWCMQAAIPANSFAHEGDFSKALFGYFDDGSYSARVWYSHLDSVLSTAYLYAKQAPAMGQFGCGSALPSGQIDVTNLSGTAHSEESADVVGGYFKAIGPRLKQELHSLLST